MTPGELELLLACRANPLEDVPRLQLADWLQEHADPEQPCPGCQGTSGPGWFCKACDGRGTVPGDRTQRAELIRVQVELASVAEPIVCMESATSISFKPGYPFARREELLAREVPLIAANPHWLPGCPACEGKGYHGTRSHHTECATCRNSAHRGRIASLTRGLVEVVPVPRLATVLKPCERCGGHGDIIEAGYAGDCPGCERAELRPTAWARSLLDGWPCVRSVVPGDREPYRTSAGFYRWWKGENTSHVTAGLPDPVYDAMMLHLKEKAEWPRTREAAVDALGEAVADVLLKLIAKEKEKS